MPSTHSRTPTRPAPHTLSPYDSTITTPFFSLFLSNLSFLPSSSRTPFLPRHHLILPPNTSPLSTLYLSSHSYTLLSQFPRSRPAFHTLYSLPIPRFSLSTYHPSEDPAPHTIDSLHNFWYTPPRCPRALPIGTLFRVHTDNQPLSESPPNYYDLLLLSPNPTAFFYEAFASDFSLFLHFLNSIHPSHPFHFPTPSALPYLAPSSPWQYVPNAFDELPAQALLLKTTYTPSTVPSLLTPSTSYRFFIPGSSAFLENYLHSNPTDTSSISLEGLPTLNPISSPTPPLTPPSNPALNPIPTASIPDTAHFLAFPSLNFGLPLPRPFLQSRTSPLIMELYTRQSPTSPPLVSHRITFPPNGPLSIAEATDVTVPLPSHTHRPT